MHPRGTLSRPSVALCAVALAAGLAGPRGARADDPVPTPAPSAAPAPRSAGPAPAEPPELASGELSFGALERFSLPNGVHVVLDPMPGRRTAAVVVSVDRGQRDQRAGWTGLAHVTEHVLFGGTRAAPGDWNERIEALGRVDGNGVTTQDRTYYYDVVPAERVHELLWLDADRFAHAARDLDPRAVEHERAIVLREWGERNLNAQLAPSLVRAALYPVGHPYALSVERRDDIEAIGASEVRWFLQTAYRPERLTVVVSGGFDLERVRETVTAAFSPLVSDPIPPSEDRPEECPAPARGERRILIDIRRPNDVLSVYWNVPSAGSEWAPALRAAATALGRRIRQRLGVGTDQAYVERDDGDLCTLIEVHVEVPRDRGTADALGVVDTAVDEITRQGLYTDAERERWLQGWLDTESTVLSSPSSRGIRFSQRLRGFPDGRYDPVHDQARHRAVTAERVREAVTRFFPRNARTVVSLSAHRTAPFVGRMVTDIVLDRDDAAATQTGGGS